jgi:amicyanin
VKIAILAAAAIALTAACSSPAPNTAPSASFSPGMTPGMSGQGTPGTQTPAATAPATAAPAPQGGSAVGITDFKFVPATLTVPVGTTVTWTNNDEEPHAIAAKDGSFHGPGMDTHGTYSFTFTNPGSYNYVCSIHPFMTGTVVVTK